MSDAAMLDQLFTRRFEACHEEFLVQSACRLDDVPGFNIVRGCQNQTRRYLASIRDTSQRGRRHLPGDCIFEVLYKLSFTKTAEGLLRVSASVGHF